MIRRRNNIFYFTLSGILMLLFFAGCGSGESTPPLDTYAFERIVKVYADDIGQVGSGFFISPNGLIVTNFHLLNTFADDNGKLMQVFSQQLSVRMPGGEVIRPSVVAGPGFKLDPRIEAYDFVLLKIDKHDLPYFIFGDSGSLREEDEVHFAGYMLADTVLEVGSGRVSDLFNYPRSGYRIDLAQVNNVDNGGLSGGPVLNDRLEVVGILSMLDVTSKIELASGRLDPGDPAVGLVKTRSNLFGSMISNRTDVGYAVLADPVSRYLREIDAIREQ